MGRVRVKRNYNWEPATQADGFRVLVDRLWPRGVAKERAALDLWMKTVAPSPELRHWFGHDPSGGVNFRRDIARSCASIRTCQCNFAPTFGVRSDR